MQIGLDGIIPLILGKLLLMKESMHSTNKISKKKKEENKIRPIPQVLIIHFYRSDKTLLISDVVIVVVVMDDS